MPKFLGLRTAAERYAAVTAMLPLGPSADAACRQLFESSARHEDVAQAVERVRNRYLKETHVHGAWSRESFAHNYKVEGFIMRLKPVLLQRLMLADLDYTVELMEPA